MSIQQIGAVGAFALSGAAFESPAATSVSMRPMRSHVFARSEAPDFMQMLGTGLERLDHGMRAADARMRGVALGDDTPLHETMIAMEQARMRLMLAIEVRNRLIEAYQELTRMQL